MSKGACENCGKEPEEGLNKDAYCASCAVLMTAIINRKLGAIGVRLNAAIKEIGDVADAFRDASVDCEYYVNTSVKPFHYCKHNKGTMRLDKTCSSLTCPIVNWGK